MSRGPGRWQRVLLGYLDADPYGAPVTDLVRDVVGREPVRAEMVAARRAARSLHGMGCLTFTCFDRRR